MHCWALHSIPISWPYGLEVIQNLQIIPVKREYNHNSLLRTNHMVNVVAPALHQPFIDALQLPAVHNILILPRSQPVKKEVSIISSFMSFTNVLDWSRTGSGLHSIIPEHIRTCTRVSQATRAEYRQKYFTTLALCLQIIPVRRPLVSGGEGPEQWYHFKYLSWPHPGSPGKKP